MKNKFDTSVFQRHLSTQWLGQSFAYFEELESTNSYVKTLPRSKVSHGLLCLTDNQTRGRGQYERKWESQPARNLTFSVVFQPQSSERFHVLTLSFALAIVELLDEIFKNRKCVSIKWPNDVMIGGKKVSGLLTESMFSGNKLDRLVIGIGFNVNQDAFTPKVEEKATSLRLEKGDEINREQLLSELLGRMEYKYNLWHRKQTDLLKSINRKIVGYGEWIKLKVNGKLLDDPYKLLGINEQGQLLVLNKEGGIQSYSYEQIRLVTD